MIIKLIAIGKSQNFQKNFRFNLKHEDLMGESNLKSTNRSFLLRLISS